jgi:hypothetical protein
VSHQLVAVQRHKRNHGLVRGPKLVNQPGFGRRTKCALVDVPNRGNIVRTFRPDFDHCRFGRRRPNALALTRGAAAMLSRFAQGFGGAVGYSAC